MNLGHLDETARLQQGLVTGAQVREQKVTANQLKHLVRSGKLIRLHPNVYCYRGSADTWAQRILALSLSFGGRAAVSHRAAARAWGLPGFEEDPTLDLAMKQGSRRKLDGVAVHVVADDDFVVMRRGVLWLTPLARTLLDLSSVESPAKVAHAVDLALNRRMITPEQLRTAFEGWAARGRNGTARMRPVLQSIIEDGTRSFLERKALKWIRAAGIRKPVGQHQVIVDGIPWTLDIAWPDLKVAVEPGGYRFHGTRSAFDQDAKKVAALVGEAWRIIPMTSKTQCEPFLRDVAGALKASRREKAA